MMNQSSDEKAVKGAQVGATMIILSPQFRNESLLFGEESSDTLGLFLWRWGL